MTAFANASADEARRIVEEFLDTIFDGHADNAVATRMRAALPELPSEPSAEQIDAWVELATLVHDDAFRARVREMVVAGDAERRVRNLIATDEATQAAGALVLEKAGAATQAGIGPDTPQARDVLDSIVPAFADAAGADDTPAYRAALLAQMERFTDRRVDRYWRLIGVINGWPERPDMFGPYAWFIDALRAAG